MKSLYVMVCDRGDGSYSVNFTLDTDWIKQQESLDNEGELECGSVGVDGDGFHYTTLTVPDDATYESLNINVYEIVGH